MKKLLLVLTTIVSFIGAEAQASQSFTRCTNDTLQLSFNEKDTTITVTINNSSSKITQDYKSCRINGFWLKPRLLADQLNSEFFVINETGDIFASWELADKLYRRRWTVDFSQMISFSLQESSKDSFSIVNFHGNFSIKKIKSSGKSITISIKLTKNQFMFLRKTEGITINGKVFRSDGIELL